DVRFKAWNAREHGAVGMIVVDVPVAEKAEKDAQEEAPLPEPRVDTSIAGSGAGDAGLPVVYLSRAAGAGLFQGDHRAALTVALQRRSQPAANIVGVLRAGGPDRLPGAVLVGAHYDHLG